MQYWDLVTRSFRIAWRYKYLWLLAIFAGEAGAGFNYNSGAPGQAQYNGYSPSPDFNGAINQVTSWLSGNVGFVALVTALALVVIVVFFVLAAVCEGALVRAVAEHADGRPFGLRDAWSAGRGTMGTIVRFRLVLLALWLPVVVVLIALIGGAVVAFFAGDNGGGVVLVGIAILLILVGIPYGIYLFLLDRMGSRAAILEHRQAMAALGRGHGLIMRRLGRVLLVWLLSIGVGIALGIGLACVFGLLFLPLAISAAVSNSVPLTLILGLAATIVALPVQGFFGAQSSTYWTLAFRGMEFDQPPAFSYAYPPPPLPGAG